MTEFVPLTVTELLEPALLVIGLLAAGGVAIILLEGFVLFAYRVGSRLAGRMHERHARP
ncbi:MAG: hypothetical protein JSV86_20100 [Gemmatimonadota bacterium]|nr:MAG: hypothetical protein JSV86_20100 [Gemmatimonadota bacterium]